MRHNDVVGRGIFHGSQGIFDPDDGSFPNDELNDILHENENDWARIREKISWGRYRRSDGRSGRDWGAWGNTRRLYGKAIFGVQLSSPVIERIDQALDIVDAAGRLAKMIVMARSLDVTAYSLQAAAEFLEHQMTIPLGERKIPNNHREISLDELLSDPHTADDQP